MKPGTCRSGGTTSRSLRRGNSPRRSRRKPDSRSISADTLGSSVRSTPQNHRRSSSRCKNWSACSSFAEGAIELRDKKIDGKHPSAPGKVRADAHAVLAVLVHFDAAAVFVAMIALPRHISPLQRNPCSPVERIRKSACDENGRSRLSVHDSRPNLLAETLQKSRRPRDRDDDGN